MTRLINITGKQFGRLVVTAYAGVNKRRGSRWKCLCDCGARGIVDAWHLRSGQSQSCGCLQRELTIARSTKHGRSNSPEYYSWQAMKQRCSKPYATSYEYYGARGIRVCERWLNSFSAFYQDMGPRPEGCSVDRINVNDDYRPDNCRWADAKQQRQNRRPSKQRKRRRSSLAEIQAFVALTASARGVRAAP
jgi:hypothetical protein